MTDMKKYALYILMLVMGCSLVNAQTYVLTSVAEQGSTYLNTEKNVYFGTEASERFVDVETNVDFTVESDAAWCKVEQAEDAIKLTVAANASAEERSAVLTIKAKDALSCTMMVHQHGTDAEKYPTFAVISDLHFGASKGDGPMSKVPRSLKQLTAKGKLDAIIVCGDITDGGYEEQYDQLVEVFTDEDNFINPVDNILFMMGNHDNYGGRAGNYPVKLRPFNNGENYPYDQYMVIKGYPFITISVRGSDNNDLNAASALASYPMEVREKLAAWLEKAATECPGKPIFVFTHVPPKYTCYSTWPGEGSGGGSLWGMSALNSILNKYPQAVVFGGHSHYPLGDPRSIHQGVNPKGAEQNYYTGVGTGSINYSEIHGPAVDWSDPYHPNFYEYITEGLIVDVKPAGNVEIRRYDTRLDEEIQPDNRWNLEAPFDGSKFAYADKRDQYSNALNKPYRDGLPAPVFAAEAKVDVACAGTNATVTFSQATDNDCVFRYKVMVFNAKGFAIRNQWVFSEFYRNSDMPETLTASFTGLELDTEYTAVVEAYDSYDNVSEKLVSKTFTLSITDVEVPARIGSWTFDAESDKLVNGADGAVELIPGVIAEGLDAKELLSEIGVTYVEGPAEGNGAIRLPAGAIFNINYADTLSTYTLLYDVKVPTLNIFRSLIQTNPLNNDDGDIFINKTGQLGLFDMGYGGTCKIDTWHRIVVSVTDGCPTIYLDGQQVAKAKTSGNTRWVIIPNGGYLFLDQDGEMGEMDIAELALWNQALSDLEVLKLGSFNKSEISYSMTVNRDSLDLTDMTEFTLTVSANVEPSFTLPEWVYLKSPVPSIGNLTYYFGILPMGDDMEREGEIVVSAPAGAGIDPVTVVLTQTNVDNEVPEPFGLWDFDDEDEDIMYFDLINDLYLEPYQVVANNEAPSPFEKGADNGVRKTAEGIALSKTTCLFFELDEEEDLRDYAIAFDVKATNVNNFISLYQTTLENDIDGKLFISKGMVGINAGGLGYGGSVAVNTWHRIVVSVRDGIVSTFIDGEHVRTSANTHNDNWVINQFGFYFFCDNDGEHNDIEVGGLQFWKQPLNKGQVANLGKFEPIGNGGNEVEVPVAQGTWTFDDADDLLANSGEVPHVIQSGITDGTGVYGTSLDGAGITQVDGPAKGNKAIFVPAKAMLDFSFANSSDEKVQNYTIMFDLRVSKINFNAMLQPNLQNDTDAMFFMNQNGYIGHYANGNWGYSGQIIVNTWHRVIISVKDGIPNAYLDGVLVVPGKNTFNGAWILDPQGCYLFCDNDGERVDTEVSEIRYWDVPLTDTEVLTLGKVKVDE